MLHTRVGFAQLDRRAREQFENELDSSRAEGAPNFASAEDAVKTLWRAAALGSQEANQDPVFFEELLGDPEGYKYTSLLRLTAPLMR